MHEVSSLQNLSRFCVFAHPSRNEAVDVFPMRRNQSFASLNTFWSDLLFLGWKSQIEKKLRTRLKLTRGRV